MVPGSSRARVGVPVPARMSLLPHSRLPMRGIRCCGAPGTAIASASTQEAHTASASNSRLSSCIPVAAILVQVSSRAQELCPSSDQPLPPVACIAAHRYAVSSSRHAAMVFILPLPCWSIRRAPIAPHRAAWPRCAGKNGIPPVLAVLPSAPVLGRIFSGRWFAR